MTWTRILSDASGKLLNNKHASTLPLQPSSGLGNAPKDGHTHSLLGSPVATSLTVAPGLPLLRAVLRRTSAPLNNAGAMGAVLAAVPSDEELAGVQSVPAAPAPVAASSAAENKGDTSVGFKSPSNASVVDTRSPPNLGGVSGTPTGIPPFIKPPSTSMGVGGVGSAGKGPVTVWHGQRCTLELLLTNLGSVAVSSITQLIVTNARGQPLKPLPRDVGGGRGGGSGLHPQGRMPSSASGVHMEPSEGALAALAAAMPLAPGASVMVSVDLNVGRPPFSDPFEEVVLEVCVAYAGAGLQATPPPVSSTLIPDGRGVTASDTSASPVQEDRTHATGPASDIASSQVLGRRLALPVRFKIQPTVQVPESPPILMGTPLMNLERSLTPHHFYWIIN